MTQQSRTVVEITTHIRKRLIGIPGVTTNSIQSLVFGWLRAEQPEVLEVITAEEICGVIHGNTG